jgi:hypothetical protein
MPACSIAIVIFWFATAGAFGGDYWSRSIDPGSRMPRTFACIAAEDGIGAEARYPFFFGRMLLTGVSMPLVNKEVAAAGAAGLAVFGLRVSRLPRFCPLAMLLSSVCRV